MMVCLGNICRSPLAHGILQKEIIDQNLNWEVESSGTSSFHNGELPDKRSIEVAEKNGIDIRAQRSRLFLKNDLHNFDLILTMDSSNYQNVIRMASSEEEREKVKLLLNYAYPNENRAVPDPYYEGGFQSIFDMINEAVLKLIEAYSK